MEVTEGLIAIGIAKLKREPSNYLAIWYANSQLRLPEGEQQYTMLCRLGTRGFVPQGCTPEGPTTVIVAEYQRLPSARLPHVDKALREAADGHTDNFTYGAARLHSEANRPFAPGRGMGVGDVPSLKIVGDIDPSDIAQVS